MIGITEKKFDGINLCGCVTTSLRRKGIPEQCSDSELTQICLRLCQTDQISSQTEQDRVNRQGEAVKNNLS